MLKREPSIFNVAGLGTKHLTKEYVEALCRMVDMEKAGDRDSVKFVGTITCDEEEALVLAEAESSLMGVSNGSDGIWLGNGCTNHRTTDDDHNREQHVLRQMRYELKQKSRKYVTPSVVYVTPYGERYHVQRGCLRTEEISQNYGKDTMQVLLQSINNQVKIASQSKES